MVPEENAKVKKKGTLKIPRENSADTISDDSSSNESDEDEEIPVKNKFAFKKKKKDIPLISYQSTDGAAQPRETVTLPAPPPTNKKQIPFLAKANKRHMTTAFDDDSDEDQPKEQQLSTQNTQTGLKRGKSTRRVSLVASKANTLRSLTNQKSFKRSHTVFITDDSALIIPFNSPFRTRWDIMIIVLSLWVCFSLPVQIAFEPASLDGVANYYMNLLADIVYILDIFINFRTTIRNTLTNEEIAVPREIAIQYVKSRFLIDLVASIPFDLMLGNSDSDRLSTQLRIFSILKMIRILRFFKVISYLNTTSNVKLSLKLVKLIFYLFVYLHLQACAWFFYTKQDRHWYPILDLIKESYHFYDESPLYLYCFSVWHSVSILDGADMVPANAHQAIVVSILVFFSEFIHAHILGTIGVVLHALNHKSSKFQEQIEFVTSAMKNLKLSEEIQRNVLHYITQAQSDIDAQKEMNELMTMVSPNLKTQITQHLFLKAIKENPNFISQLEVVEYLLQTIEAFHYLPEEYILKQGQKATHMYILAHGQCEVLVRDQYKREGFVRNLISGQLFGEVALLYQTKRTASIRCKDQCTLAGLNEEHFRDLMRIYPEVKKSLMQGTKRYKDHWKLYQIGVLSEVDYLEDIPYKTKEDLHYKIQLQYFEKGAKIFTRGSECKAIYFVTGGELELIVDQEKEEYILDVLIPGCQIGAYSIVNSSIFPYTARAKTNLALLVLQREDMLSLVDDSEHLSDAIEEATEFIIDNEVPLCDYTLPPDTTQLKGMDDYLEGDGVSRLRKKFRAAVERLKILHKGKTLKNLKLVELLDMIKQQKKQQQSNMMKLVNIQQQAQQRMSQIVMTGGDRTPGQNDSLSQSIKQQFRPRASAADDSSRRSKIFLQVMSLASENQYRQSQIHHGTFSQDHNDALPLPLSQFRPRDSLGTAAGVSRRISAAHQQQLPQEDLQDVPIVTSRHMMPAQGNATKMERDITKIQQDLSQLNTKVQMILDLLMPKKESRQKHQSSDIKQEARRSQAQAQLMPFILEDDREDDSFRPKNIKQFSRETSNDSINVTVNSKRPSELLLTHQITLDKGSKPETNPGSLKVSQRASSKDKEHNRISKVHEKNLDQNFLKDVYTLKSPLSPLVQGEAVFDQKSPPNLQSMFAYGLQAQLKLKLMQSSEEQAQGHSPLKQTQQDGNSQIEQKTPSKQPRTQAPFMKNIQESLMSLSQSSLIELPPSQGNPFKAKNRFNQGKIMDNSLSSNSRLPHQLSDARVLDYSANMTNQSHLRSQSPMANRSNPLTQDGSFERNQNPLAQSMQEGLQPNHSALQNHPLSQSQIALKGKQGSNQDQRGPGKQPPTRQGAKYQSNPALEAYMKGAGAQPVGAALVHNGIKEESRDGSHTAGESTLLINGLQLQDPSDAHTANQKQGGQKQTKNNSLNTHQIEAIINEEINYQMAGGQRKIKCAHQQKCPMQEGARVGSRGRDCA